MEKHISTFESFSSPAKRTAEDLGNREYWADFDYNDGLTADDWQNDPGYQALAEEMSTPLSQILAFDTESDEGTDELMSEIRRYREAPKTIESTHPYLETWEYYPESGIAIARGYNGAPDYIFTTPDYNQG